MAKNSVITVEFKAIQTSLEALEPLDETQRRFAISMILARLGMDGTAASAQVPGGGLPFAGLGAGGAAAAATGGGGDGGFRGE